MSPNSPPENLNGATAHSPNTAITLDGTSPATEDDTRFTPTPNAETADASAPTFNNSTPLPQTETPEPLLLSDDDTWWPLPKFLSQDKNEATGWSAPPVVKGESQGITKLLAEIHPFQAEILTDLETSALEARRELELLVINSVSAFDAKNRTIHHDNRNLNAKLDPLQTKLDGAKQETFSARKESQQALAAAGLSADAQDIRSAVEAVAPDEAILSGSQGVIRQSDEAPGWVMTWAALVIGTIVGALTLGSLLGIFYPSDLDKLQNSWPRLAIAALCGTVLVEVLGLFGARFMQNLAPYLLARETDETPRRDTFRHGVAHRLGLALLAVGLVIMVMLLLSAVAEVTLGSVGVHMASEDHVARTSRNKEGQALTTTNMPEPLSWLLCVAVAVVFVSPYLYTKMLGAWFKVENGMVSDWIAACRAAWITERLNEEPVKKAGAALGGERSIGEQVASFQDQIVALEMTRQPYVTDFTREEKLRIESARVAASGEAERLREFMKRAANDVDPILVKGPSQAKGSSQPTSKKAVDYNPNPLPWWHRLWQSVTGKGSRQDRQGRLSPREL